MAIPRPVEVLVNVVPLEFGSMVQPLSCCVPPYVSSTSLRGCWLSIAGNCPDIHWREPEVDTEAWLAG